jgi:Holliday junction resolvasome RuvABC DNA-binding subunit
MPVAGADEAPAARPSGGPKEDLLSALVNLGYSRGEVERGVDRALHENGAGRFEDLLRRALQIVAGR